MQISLHSRSDDRPFGWVMIDGKEATDVYGATLSLAVGQVPTVNLLLSTGRFSPSADADVEVDTPDVQVTLGNKCYTLIEKEPD